MKNSDFEKFDEIERVVTDVAQTLKELADAFAEVGQISLATRLDWGARHLNGAAKNILDLRASIVLGKD